MFLKTGITFETLSREGKVPLSIDMLNKRERGIEISCFKSLSMRTGMLWGPEDLEGERELIILTTSSGVVGVKKMELRLRFKRKSSKLRLVGGILVLIVSAIELK